MADQAEAERCLQRTQEAESTATRHTLAQLETAIDIKREAAQFALQKARAAIGAATFERQRKATEQQALRDAEAAQRTAQASFEATAARCAAERRERQHALQQQIAAHQAAQQVEDARLEQLTEERREAEQQALQAVRQRVATKQQSVAVAARCAATEHAQALAQTARLAAEQEREVVAATQLKTEQALRETLAQEAADMRRADEARQAQLSEARACSAAAKQRAEAEQQALAAIQHRHDTAHQRSLASARLLQVVEQKRAAELAAQADTAIRLQFELEQLAIAQAQQAAAAQSCAAVTAAHASQLEALRLAQEHLAAEQATALAAQAEADSKAEAGAIATDLAQLSIKQAEIALQEQKIGEQTRRLAQQRLLDIATALQATQDIEQAERNASNEARARAEILQQRAALAALHEQVERELHQASAAEQKALAQAVQEKQELVAQQQAQHAVQEKIRHAEMSRQRALWRTEMARQAGVLANDLAAAEQQANAAREARRALHQASLSAIQSKQLACAQALAQAERELQNEEALADTAAQALLAKVRGRASNAAAWRQRADALLADSPETIFTALPRSRAPLRLVASALLVIATGWLFVAASVSDIGLAPHALYKMIESPHTASLKEVPDAAVARLTESRITPVARLKVTYSLTENQTAKTQDASSTMNDLAQFPATSRALMASAL